MRTCHQTGLIAVSILMVLLSTALPTFAQQSWTPIRVASAEQDLNTVFFLDSKRGWVGGDKGFMSRTDDGGHTWVRQDVGTSNAINDIYFRDKEDGFLIAGNTILVTSDSGTRWTQARRFLPAEFDGGAVELYSVRFSSKNKGWVVGSISKGDRVIDSILVYTDDGGTNWQRQRVPSKSELIHIDFDNDRRGWIVGAGGVIINTLDGGTTWNIQKSGTSATLFHVEFRNEKKGWAVGERGTILKTTDGGNTWTSVTASVRSTLLSVEFVNDDDGWAVGRGGAIVRSDDGGLTWVQQDATVKENLYALYFHKKIGWAVGGNGLVLRYERD
jgi:photosystem II stability/assembly factor-like uncharacterized protein